MTGENKSEGAKPRTIRLQGVWVRLSATVVPSRDLGQPISKAAIENLSVTALSQTDNVWTLHLIGYRGIIFISISFWCPGTYYTLQLKGPSLAQWDVLSEVFRPTERMQTTLIFIIKKAYDTIT